MLSPPSRSWAAVALCVSAAALSFLVGCQPPPPAKESASPSLSLHEWIRLQGEPALMSFPVIDEYREGVAASSSEPLRLPVERIGPGKKLEFAYAISSGAAAHRNKTHYRFAVYWRDPDGGTRLLSERTTRTDTRWFDESVPLNDLAVSSGEFRFVVTAGDPAPSGTDRPPSVPVWGDARIVPAAPTPDERPNILWVTIDTVRADHVGFDGYARDTTPFTDGLAKSGVRFTAAYAHAPWTIPSTWSMMRSRYYDEADRSRRDYLPEVLRANGYTAVGWIGNNALPGYDVGFARYFEVLDQTVPERFRTWLEGRPPGPFFAYVHLLGAHRPYVFRAGFSEAFIGEDEKEPMAFESRPEVLVRPSDESVDRMIRLYDGEIRASDGIVEELVESLAVQGLLDTTYLVVTSDHGEEFWEHGGFGHGHTFFDELLHVPLVLVPPQWRTPRNIASSVGLIRVAPTLLAAVGIAPPESYIGRPLDLDADGGEDDAIYVADMYFPDLFYRILQPTLPPGMALADRDPIVTGLRTPDLKSVLDHRGEVIQIFDLRADPGERANLVGNPATTERSKAMWALFRERTKAASKTCGTYHVRLSSDAPAQWDVEWDSDRRIVPVLVDQDAPAVRWEQNPDGRQGVFHVAADAAGIHTIEVKEVCEARRLSVRILRDGRPLDGGRVRLPGVSGVVTSADALANLAQAPVRDALRVSPDAENPAADGAWAVLWMTVDPVPRPNDRPDDAERARLEALRSLGYL